MVILTVTGDIAGPVSEYRATELSAPGRSPDTCGPE